MTVTMLLGQLFRAKSNTTSLTLQCRKVLPKFIQGKLGIKVLELFKDNKHWIPKGCLHQLEVLHSAAVSYSVVQDCFGISTHYWVERSRRSPKFLDTICDPVTKSTDKASCMPVCKAWQSSHNCRKRHQNQILKFTSRIRITEIHVRLNPLDDTEDCNHLQTPSCKWQCRWGTELSTTDINLLGLQNLSKINMMYLGLCKTKQKLKALFVQIKFSTQERVFDCSRSKEQNSKQGNIQICGGNHSLGI